MLSSDWNDWYWYEDDWSSYWHEDWSGSANWEASSVDYELRGAQDSEDCQYDHLSKIFALIAAAKDKKKNQDYWELSESLGTLTRHHVKKRNSLFDFNVIRSDPPIEVERLTGKRETFKKYSKWIYCQNC